MFRTALLFSGQGAQTVGMGKDLAQNFASAADLFRQADTILGNRVLSKLAYADEVQGASEHRPQNVYGIPEESGVDISLLSSRDAVETDEARRTKDFDAGLYASYCPSPNSSPTQHSSSLPQVVVDGDETIRSNTGATKQFAVSVEFRKKSRSCQRKGAIVNQDHIISFILSQGQGAKRKMQHARKASTAGKTKARASSLEFFDRNSS